MFNITEILSLNEIGRYDNGKLELTAHIHLEPIKGVNKFVLKFSHGSQSYCEEVKIEMFWTDSDSIGLASDNAMNWITRNFKHITSNNNVEQELSAICHIVKHCILRYR